MKSYNKILKGWQQRCLHGNHVRQIYMSTWQVKYIIIQQYRIQQQYRVIQEANFFQSWENIRKTNKNNWKTQ